MTSPTTAADSSNKPTFWQIAVTFAIGALIASQIMTVRGIAHQHEVLESFYRINVKIAGTADNSYDDGIICLIAKREARLAADMLRDDILRVWRERDQ